MPRKNSRRDEPPVYLKPDRISRVEAAIRPATQRRQHADAAHRPTTSTAPCVEFEAAEVSAVDVLGAVNVVLYVTLVIGALVNLDAALRRNGR